MTCQSIIFHLFTYGILLYSFLLLVSYLFIGFYSIGEIRRHLRRNSFADFRMLAASDQLPGISIIAPAYNEAANIIENVRSMLSIHYNTLELIIVNDGSKDDSLKRLIAAYDLYKTDMYVNEQIATKPIKGIYKSRNPVFKKLIIIDKVNGGKADALNVGINVSKYGYIVCVDVDCVLEQDALLKMIKPFLEETTVKVIASGGVIRIANDCKIENGRLIKVNLPKKLLPRIQTLEYIRAFLLGRMAWSRLNGLLLISGAFGAFDKEIVIKCGGYNTKTVGEDMELIVRMRRYMEELKIAYRVTFIPDPLCWTEAPANYKILGRQRNRWTRGTIETLRMHKVMFFNPKYHIIGMISYPYWFFFEFLAPLIEFIGIAGFLLFAFFGLIAWPVFFTLLGCILSFGFLYSVFAILMEVLTYNQYKNKYAIIRLVAAAFVEPFIFHPFAVWSALKGYIDYLRKKNSWGEMTRQGFNPGTVQAQVVQEPSPVDEVVELPEMITEKETVQPSSFFYKKLLPGIKEAAAYSLVAMACMVMAALYEFLRGAQQFGMPQNFLKVFSLGLVNTISFILNFGIIPLSVFIFLFVISKQVARFFMITFLILFIGVQLALAQYFLETLVPLGADLWKYSIADIQQTVGAAGISTSFIWCASGILAISIFLFISLQKKIILNAYAAYGLLLLFVISTVFSSASITSKWKPGQEFSNNISLSKSYFFYNSTCRFFNNIERQIINADTPSAMVADANAFKYIDEANYPFLHTVDTTSDVLSPFFNKQAVAPNIVFIVVEGLGTAFSNKDAYLGSFTPFLDSLSGKSLYWNNFLSAGGRSFAMLPSVFGSLPFSKNGFAELAEQMPQHQSLFTVLKENGYESNFFYGGNADFDRMNIFLNRNGAVIHDEKSFAAGYEKMPSANGFTWGYGDEEVLRKYNETTKGITTPMCNVVLTLSTHNPFIIKEEKRFNALFEDRMQLLGFNDAEKEEHRRYRDQYSSVLYTDNAIRQLMTSYAGRADFKNTIFIITGDHRMPEIPISSKIDRYHVPLIIYSPMLKTAASFTAVSSHLDIMPSLLSFLHHQYNFKTPAVATWLGTGLDTAHTFRNLHAYPLMQTKNDLVDYVMNDYLLNGDDLYKISDHMNIDLVSDDRQKEKLKNAFSAFKRKNNTLAAAKQMLPDSLMNR